MIDTKELRFAASKSIRDLALLPSEVNEILDRLEAAEKEREIDEQRIADLMAELNRVGHENDELRAEIKAMEHKEPVAWRTFDGEGGYDYRNVADNEDYQAVWEARNPNHKGWVEPLYLAPGAQPEESDTSKALIDLLRAERDALRAKIAEMEKQEPVAKVESWTNGSYTRHYKLKWLRDVNEGAKLYALPDAKGEEK